MAVVVRELKAADESAWDCFVQAHAHGSPFHEIAWKRSMEQSFGFRAVYLLAERDGALCAVLPLFLVKNFLLGKALISSPFAVYGGVLADGEEARAAMRAALERLSRELRVDYTELRNAWPEQCLGFSPVTRYVTFTQQLGETEEAILESIPRKTRRMVRRALENPFEVRQGSELEAFESLYLANLRRLGTPAFPHKHFVNLLRNFGSRAAIREVRLDGQVAAAVFTFYFRDQVLPYYGAADGSKNEYNPSNFMYYDQMLWARKNGYSIFDFGRSKKESGSGSFKSHWGMAERELPYEMLLVRRRELPNFTPKNPRFQLAIRVWQRLPLALTKRIGPLLIRLVP